MAQVLVGVFERSEQAQQAHRELIERGVDPQHIQLAASQPPPDQGDEIGSSVERSMSIHASIGDLFRSLFVEFGGPSDDVELYNEAIRRGGMVMSVQAQDERHASTVREVMERHGVADLGTPGAAAIDLSVLGEAPGEALEDTPQRQKIRVYSAAQRMDRQQ
ncbi:hypothetical protein M8A51_12565 [Schlegelella sp. S2-27]|uniref:Heat induced stress protein YflT n=1 Tax=Caldimonas mangrovi TaxID=2944811 RepID=A0ABT0YNP3_9BURK|nr:hypothetical protein [Caldimonas mangrovi]MCM5680363.1 hypothetical protein [Caldimonas mangrovi]